MRQSLLFDSIIFLSILAVSVVLIQFYHGPYKRLEAEKHQYGFILR